ncbi:unnamed protein product [Diabrotica balteata]|uniref:Sodium/potassium-transporting ATPase subunit beta-1-interacting protein n=1 Tax=Diabrotica balteata TaxID=107213 RepID=A0A9N9SSY7_DIABA|nr:unnamed protein product [Diabrotica balteata]
MGICSRRNVFLSICFLQMVAVVERQVFDFLGFLWIPILVNFFEIIFIIFGFFGAYQYRPKYIIAYLLWHLFWIGWNIFMICLYLNVAGLDHEVNDLIFLSRIISPLSYLFETLALWVFLQNKFNVNIAFNKAPENLLLMLGCVVMSLFHL